MKPGWGWKYLLFRFKIRTLGHTKIKVKPVTLLISEGRQRLPSGPERRREPDGKLLPGSGEGEWGLRQSSGTQAGPEGRRRAMRKGSLSSLSFRVVRGCDPRGRTVVSSLNIFTVSPLHTNLQVANFQRCERASGCSKEAVPPASGVSETAARPPSPIADDPSALPSPTSSTSSSQ